MEKDQDVFTVLSGFSGTMRNLFSELIDQIKDINKRTKMLSINAGIEAARSGEAGKGFAIVAAEMNKLTDETLHAAKDMESQANKSAENLEHMTSELASNVTGTRLSDLSLTNIEFIDRNLYERSCDVRWWATDNSVVEAATDNSEEKRTFANKRLGIILDAYTVYFDIVLCDLQGNVIANGRPNDYASIGTNQKDQKWFNEALNSQSGDEYGFQTVHTSPLVNGERVLVYSCSVRQGGNANGTVAGVLGVIFRYDALAQTIVHATPLMEHEKPRSRACIIDNDKNIIADSHDKVLTETLDFPGIDQLLAQKKGFVTTKIAGKQHIIGYALSPGYETYNTGWHSLILQRLEK